MKYERVEQAGDTGEEITVTFKQWGYESPCLIGKGAFAGVYRVKKCSSGRMLACKVSGAWELLRQEGILLRQIKHPLFPEFFDCRERNGVGFLFMEYIPGTGLGTLIRRRGRLSQRQAARIGTALAEGLCYLHEQSVPIIFRDLKPENVVIKENGEVKLVDLGSAVRMNAALGTITGTDGYAAPEQWSDAEKVGSYSDVYALGRVMYFMLGKGKIQRGLAQLLEDCVRQEIRERIPVMRYLLNGLQPYAVEDKKAIRKKERELGLHRRRESEYFFQQNIVRF